MNRHSAQLRGAQAPTCSSQISVGGNVCVTSVQRLWVPLSLQVYPCPPPSLFSSLLSLPLPHLPVLWFVLPFTWATADIPWERQRGKGFRGETTAMGHHVKGRLGWQGNWGGRREVRRREEGGGKEGTRRWKKTGGREPQPGLCRVGPPAGKKSLGVR